MDMNWSKLWEGGEDTGARHAAVHGITKSQTRLRQDGSKRFGRESLKSDSITNLSFHCSLWKL